MPYSGVGRCLGPEGNWVSSKDGGEGGPGPQTEGKISSLAPARKEAHGAGGRREEEPGMTTRTQRAQSEHC